METVAEWIEDTPTDSSPAHNANWKNVHYLMTPVRVVGKISSYISVQHDDWFDARCEMADIWRDTCIILADVH